ncbi:hypothetical protein K227x_48060 [Rubripirellula lacrimiformis]|uniref:DUF1559 domain-containing protein n=1 Tax=Rubripirellula lacrimiformis TaxID=1930273 RepID=A0A517NGY6_9BACT|nr:DUF1559 domain-containing protein [Rubripirellula lacrimiformis]QDT06397.1 hypothetical protein K227x_48060 [Rubripirellula lacrimiformis]
MSQTFWIVMGALFAAMLICGGLLPLVDPAPATSNLDAMKRNESNRLKVIGFGIHNYHAVYHQLPFTVTANTAGQQRHGWRVAISQFAEGPSQWDRYDRNHAWDSVVNLAVAIDPPDVFQATDGDPGKTNVFAVVDPRGMFPPAPNRTVTFADATDGISETLLAVWLPGQQAIWSSNANLTAEQAYEMIRSLRQDQFALLLMGDGSIRDVGPDLSSEVFEAMVTRDGGEAIASTTD